MVFYGGFVPCYLTSASNIVNGPSLMTAITPATANSYSVADFVVVDGGASDYQVNNCYIVYDEYIVSDLYRQVFESALREHGISFDYNTVTCNSVQVAGKTTNISATINDSAKQLLSVYATIRPSDIATANCRYYTIYRTNCSRICNKFRIY